MWYKHYMYKMLLFVHIRVKKLPGGIKGFYTPPASLSNVMALAEIIWQEAKHLKAKLAFMMIQFKPLNLLWFMLLFNKGSLSKCLSFWQKRWLSGWFLIWLQGSWSTPLGLEAHCGFCPSIWAVSLQGASCAAPWWLDISHTEQARCRTSVLPWHGVVEDRVYRRT